jgi:D-alanyl-D-alanine carboxypeptidase (penicillin-binding protein 5/6)
MNPEKDEHNEVYKEAARLLDWGFGATGKVTPVGELVPPKGVDTGAQAGASASAGSDAPTSTGGRGGKASASPVAASAASKDGTSGIGTALAVTGGLLVLVAGAVFLVNRRWPLPDLMRRRR